MSTESDERPLATVIDRFSNPDEDTTNWLTPRKSPLRRFLVCCGLCTAMLSIIAIVLAIVTFTVYRVRAPELTMNSFTITHPSLNITIVVDVSVKNPNNAAFRFIESTTSLYYRDHLIGVGRGPPGMAATRRTIRFNTTVDVMAHPSMTSELEEGSVELSITTDVGGTVRVLGVFTDRVDVMMNCTVIVRDSSVSTSDQNCWQRAWL